MASGTTLAAFDALSSRPPANDSPQIDLRNGHALLDFDDSTAEKTDFFAVLPNTYAGGDLYARIVWTSSTAITGNVRWSVSIESHVVGFDLDTDGFSVASETTAAGPAAAGVLVVTAVSVSSTSAGNPVAGDSIRLRVSRLAADAADTLSGDAELLAVELKEA